MKRVMFLLLSASMLLTSCSLFDNYGKKVKINDHVSIYYKGDGVTESDAKKLGDFLVANGISQGTEDKAAQISKDGDSYLVRFIIDKDKFDKNKEGNETSFWYMQDMISENVFNGKPTKISLTDNKFKDIESIDELSKVEIGKGDYVYLRGTSVNEKKAKEFGEKLEKEEFMPYTSGSIILTKEKGTYNISFLPSDKKMKEDKDHYYQILKNWQYLLGKYVLEGEDIKLFLLGDDYTVAKEFDEPTAEEKTALDQAMHPQQQTDNQTNPNQQTNPQDTIVGGGY